MNESLFMRPMHPKTEIAPSRDAITKVIKAGWWGQPKMHGHRAQIHLHANPEKSALVYNRQGQLHKKVLPVEMEQELRRLFPLNSDWTVIDTEWLKEANKLFLFDIMRRNGQGLQGMNYEERYQLLPRVYSSSTIETLPVFMNIEKCMAFMETEQPPTIEGLVFRSPSTIGFSDTAIVRCRFAKFN